MWRKALSSPCTSEKKYSVPLGMPMMVRRRTISPAAAILLGNILESISMVKDFTMTTSQSIRAREGGPANVFSHLHYYTDR